MWLANLGRWNWTSTSHLIKVFISKRDNNVVPLFYWKLKSMCAFFFSFKMKVCESNRFFFWNGFKCRVRTKKKDGVIIHGVIGHFHKLVKHNLSTQSCFPQMLNNLKFLFTALGTWTSQCIIPSKNYWLACQLYINLVGFKT